MEDLKRQTYMLLLNMLPEHVADHFLRRPSDSDELYSQSYDCTSVIFASIPGFSTYYQETEAVDGQVSQSHENIAVKLRIFRVLNACDC